MHDCCRMSNRNGFLENLVVVVDAGHIVTLECLICKNRFVMTEAERCDVDE